MKKCDTLILFNLVPNVVYIKRGLLCVLERTPSVLDSQNELWDFLMSWTSERCSRRRFPSGSTLIRKSNLTYSNERSWCLSPPCGVCFASTRAGRRGSSFTPVAIMALRWGICSAGKISHDFTVALKSLPQEDHQVLHVHLDWPTGASYSYRAPAHLWELQY